MGLTEDDFTRQLTTPPAGWKWSGWKDDGTSIVLMKDAYLIDIFDSDEPVAGESTMHVLLASKPAVRVRKGGWEVNEAGGVTALARFDYACAPHLRVVHVDLSKMPADIARDFDKRIRKSVGRRVHLSGDLPRVDFRAARDTDRQVQIKNELYNFSGFGVGCQCMLMYPRELTVVTTLFEDLKSFFKSLFA